ncbi:oxidoreductase [Rhodospirillum rubrum]|uniref:Gfo/Idh/MocA family protein n=1 Tax=Rhodospirillum rubrum TaxID=1085 RepID=UPI001904BAC1|nr:Gfo/Idh/MocA family oxidoreductase [Rhodospirillum rubrum]MBK1664307.1 oxidoreductase [Rhodospirillum rubrum]MBK1677383.1 oxidoreductase [Rhodospirillum rubrum]
MLDFDFAIDPVLPRRKDFRIGCVGAGFIMRDCHLVAYGKAGFTPYAIASLDRAQSAEVAALRAIPKVYDHWREVVRDPEVEILDIAVPPDQQLAIVEEAVKERGHIRGILAQKPLAMTLAEARRIVELCEGAGIPLGVNSNMRYDQSIRALKSLLDHGVLGERVLATIEMRAIPHWQDFLRKYTRIEILNMGIHHIDTFRHLFGDPLKVTALTRQDPRTQFPHIDGISQYTLAYGDDFLATSLDDVWAGPGGAVEHDIYIKWRVTGTEGLAEGTIGWPRYPIATPSTLRFTTARAPRRWIAPSWDTVWFPDAFAGTMAQLLCAVETGETPEISGRDNLGTLACVEAAYRSIDQERTVYIEEIRKEMLS